MKSKVADLVFHTFLLLILEQQFSANLCFLPIAVVLFKSFLKLTPMCLNSRSKHFFLQEGKKKSKVLFSPSQKGYEGKSSSSKAVPNNIYLIVFTTHWNSHFCRSINISNFCKPCLWFEGRLLSH